MKEVAKRERKRGGLWSLALVFVDVKSFLGACKVCTCSPRQTVQGPLLVYSRFGVVMASRTSSRKGRRQSQTPGQRPVVWPAPGKSSMSRRRCSRCKEDGPSSYSQRSVVHFLARPQLHASADTAAVEGGICAGLLGDAHQHGRRLCIDFSRRALKQQ